MKDSVAPCSWQPSDFHRTPETVMRLSRMGSAHQSRLSFMRTLLRRLKREKWQFERSLWEINEQGVGRAVYQAKGPRRTYSLVAFAHDLPDDLRSDRVIAEAWDSTFTLFDGVPTEDDLQRLEANVPKQEAGRVSGKELTMSRANRSMRLFNSVADTLARGEQPDREEITKVGYLMRTTAVYGSGKFGAADRDFIQDREGLSGSFQAEMLTVWLIRTFTLDLVEHAAKCRGGERAVTLKPDIRRCFGVGNSTGLGMAPFIVNHPTLLNNWMMAREEALSRVRSQQQVSVEAFDSFRAFVKRARINAAQWQSEHPIQQPKIRTLKAELAQFDASLDSFDWQQDFAWNVLYLQIEQQFSEETQEQLAMLMLEPYPELVDDLTGCMNANENLTLIDGRMSVEAMLEILQTHYAWALTIDFSEAQASSRFWYVSEEKLEPRLGQRFDEPGMELEQPLCVAWHMSQLAEALASHSQSAPLAEFLMVNSQFRHVVRRAQLATKYPYMEIQDNLIAAGMLPIDLLRLKLSFFGATRFDPRSNRWVRITMFQNAPFPHELAEQSADDWAYPALSSKIGMIYSLSEIDANCKKAARGAGLSWGHAEEAGKAARWLAAHQLPGAALLASYLSLRHENPEAYQGSHLRCPLLAGAALCDDGHNDSEQSIILENVVYPLLLLPYLAQLSQAIGKGLRVQWLNTHVSCRDGMILIKESDSIATNEATHVSCRWLEDDGVSTINLSYVRPKGVVGQSIENKDWQALESLAQHTYVPSTEASRRGAGPS